MPRVTVYLSDNTAQRVRAMAGKKGQSLSTWMERALLLALTPYGLEMIDGLSATAPKQDDEDED